MVHLLRSIMPCYYTLFSHVYGEFSSLRLLENDLMVDFYVGTR